MYGVTRVYKEEEGKNGEEQYLKIQELRVFQN